MSGVCTTVTADPAGDAGIISAASGVTLSVAPIHLEADGLIRTQVAARDETWSADGYDGEDEQATTPRETNPN